MVLGYVKGPIGALVVIREAVMVFLGAVLAVPCDLFDALGLLWVSRFPPSVPCELLVTHDDPVSTWSWDMYKSPSEP